MRNPSLTLRALTRRSKGRLQGVPAQEPAKSLPIVAEIGVPTSALCGSFCAPGLQWWPGRDARAFRGMDRITQLGTRQDTIMRAFPAGAGLRFFVLIFLGSVVISALDAGAA